MKFMHLSDLHLGKRLNGCSLMEDQKYILGEIIGIAEAEKPDGVLLAGDIYDKSVPGTEAVQLFDSFLFKLSGICSQIFVISGNHDSPERLAFGGRLMKESGVHLAPVYNGRISTVTMEDSYGALHVHMLPFLKPSHVRRFYPHEEMENYTDALAVALAGLPLHKEDRNILLAHQFVTGSLRAESEELYVGGTENVDACVFHEFDYVALGHIHNPQHIGRETLRYCGTPLKYSFSEAGHEKSVTMVEFLEKENIKIWKIPLIPRHDLREIKGDYMELTDRNYYEGSATEDYLHITLTDEEDILDAVGKLKVIYPNLLKLNYDNKRTRSQVRITGAEKEEKKTPLELFAEFYEQQNNQPMDEEQQKLVEALIHRIWEEEK